MLKMITTNVMNASLLFIFPILAKVMNDKVNFIIMTFKSVVKEIYKMYIFINFLSYIMPQLLLLFFSLLRYHLNILFPFHIFNSYQSHLLYLYFSCLNYCKTNANLGVK